MGQTAVMQSVSNFGKRELIINEQFFNLFYLMVQVKFLDGHPFHFRKNVCKVGVIVEEFFGQIIRKVDFDLFIGIMNQLNDNDFDFFNQDVFLSSINSSPLFLSATSRRSRCSLERPPEISASPIFTAE